MCSAFSNYVQNEIRQTTAKVLANGKSSGETDAKVTTIIKLLINKIGVLS